MDGTKKEEETTTQIRVEKYKLTRVTSTQSKSEGKKSVSKIPKQTFKKANRQSVVKFKTGKWTAKEKQLYQIFITGTQYNWNEKRRNKKRVRYFQEMSNFIKTRSSDQCKSHDQKMRHRFIKDEEFKIKEEEICLKEENDSQDYTTVSIYPSDTSAYKLNTCLPSISRENESTISESCYSKEFLNCENQLNSFERGPLFQNFCTSELLSKFWSINLSYNGKLGEYLDGQAKISEVFQHSIPEENLINNSDLEAYLEIMYLKLLRKRILETARTLTFEDY